MEQRIFPTWKCFRKTVAHSPDTLWLNGKVQIWFAATAVLDRPPLFFLIKNRCLIFLLCYPAKIIFNSLNRCLFRINALEIILWNYKSAMCCQVVYVLKISRSIQTNISSSVLVAKANWIPTLSQFFMLYSDKSGTYITMNRTSLSHMHVLNVSEIYLLLLRNFIFLLLEVLRISCSDSAHALHDLLQYVSWLHRRLVWILRILTETCCIVMWQSSCFWE